MYQAIQNLDINPDFIIIDAVKLESLKIPNISLIKGDQRCLSGAAASIVAKVSRDKFITTLSKKNKGYDWDKNFGYGTRQHLKALKKLGITKHHRKTFSPISKIN